MIYEFVIVLWLLGKVDLSCLLQFCKHSDFFKNKNWLKALNVNRYTFNIEKVENYQEKTQTPEDCFMFFSEAHFAN